MNMARSIGYKLLTAFKDKKISNSKICECLNFDNNDLDKLYSGRIMLSFGDLEKVSNLAESPVDQLLDYSNDDSYKDVIHCRGEFSSQENCDKILDIIDSYIDIRESLV